MPTNVSIKNVPDEIMEKLRRRAKWHHRSLQGELMIILEESVGAAYRNSGPGTRSRSGPSDSLETSAENKPAK